MNEITNNPSVPSQVIQEVKFPKFVNNLGIIPTSYKDSMSYYETLAWLCKYLEETVIPTVNQNGEATQELQGLYVQLNSYVTHYFENLDVQDEINNKLDQLVESGELQTIVTEYFSDITQRQIDFENEINAFVGDKDELTSLNNTSVVSAINTNNQLQEVYFGNSIVYDIPDVTGHIQGNCIHENLLYVAVQGDGTYGTIYVFNIVSNLYVGKYENVLMYHGNDMTYLNGKLYIASVDSLKVCIYDISNNSSSEINPFSEFSSGFNELVAVEKYDENSILCWLKTSNSNYSNTLTHDKFLILNVNSLQFEEIGMNDDYNLTSFTDTGITRQNMCISNNDFYILCINPAIIYHGHFETITNNEKVIKIDKIYNLPAKDNNHNPVGELEAVATIDNENYPTGALMITGRTFQTLKNTNVQFSKEIINNYIFSPKTGNVDYGDTSYGYPVRGVNNFGYASVGKTASNNSLLEVGSASFPFKDLIRGINSVRGKYSPCIIQIIDSSTYYLPYLFGIETLQLNINNNCNPTIYIGQIENCNIFFNLMGTATLKIKSCGDNNRTTFTNSNIEFYGNSSNSLIFEELQLYVEKGSFIKFRRCKFANTNSVSSGHAIDITDNSIILTQFDTFTINSNDHKIRYGGGSVVITNETDVVRGGIGTVITLS